MYLYIGNRVIVIAISQLSQKWKLLYTFHQEVFVYLKATAGAVIEILAIRQDRTTYFGPATVIYRQVQFVSQIVKC